MARLVIHVDIDLDPTDEDPREVAEALMYENEYAYGDVRADLRLARWENVVIRAEAKCCDQSGAPVDIYCTGCRNRA